MMSEEGSASVEGEGAAPGPRERRDELLRERGLPDDDDFYGDSDAEDDEPEPGDAEPGDHDPLPDQGESDPN
jgi:hypothetical protein